MQEAKNRFSELVEMVLAEGPQMVTRRGRDTVVVLAVEEYRRLACSRGSLVQFLQDSPLRGTRTRDRCVSAYGQVVHWVEEQDEQSLFLSVLTLGELMKGIHALSSSRRRKRLESWVEQELRPRYAGRLLQISDEVAALWGRNSGAARRRGVQIPVIDRLIAATALTHHLVVATRNAQDFELAGATAFDPWNLDREEGAAQRNAIRQRHRLFRRRALTSPV